MSARSQARGVGVGESRWALPFRSPPIYVASLADVTCYGGRLMLREPPTHSTGHLLVMDGRYLVPDSYVQRDGMRTLPAELVELEFTGTPPPVRRNGTHLLLGGAHGQFAHFPTEGPGPDRAGGEGPAGWSHGA